MKLTALDVEKKIISITQQLLVESEVEYSQRKITLDSSLQRNLGIDSLGRAELFRRIEKEFEIQLPDNLIATADNLNDIAKTIQATAPVQKIQIHGSVAPVLEKTNINPKQAKTLVDVLILYATGDPERPHIYLQDEDGREEVITYGMLFEKSLRVAHELIKRGLKPGETVAIMQPTNSGFFYTFCGILLAKCVPVPIYPPFRPNQIEAYAKQEAKILKNAEVRMLVTFHEAETLSKLLRAFVPSLKEVTTVNSLLKNDEKAPIYPSSPNDFGLIQYTSGSTSVPKGVLLTHQNLMANIRAYGEATQLSDKDVTVSWAPLYHDLGLIGMWLGSFYHGIPLTLMSPLTFLNRPERWLWAMHYHRGTISGGPNFAYELCVRKIEPSQIEGLDLSSWRLAANGAEAVQAKTLARFTEKFAPYGFKPETHFPVYGLAESTVCVATSPLNRLPRIDRIERKAYEENFLAVATTDKNSLEFVACGVPIPGHQVRIVDNDNNILPERHVGQLQFKGPSSMQGYFGNPEATMAIYHDGWWDSGDLAYVVDGEIFITGRKKDMIIKAGRNLYPSEVEELAGRVTGVRKGCVIAFATSDAQRGTEKFIVVAETRDKKPAHPETIREQITENILGALDIAPDHVVLVPPQTIPKTSSGKLQRAACKASYLAGKLSKRRTPMWVQLTKMGISFGWAKLLTQMRNLGKFIYTLYIYLLVGISIIPVYLCLWILPRRTLKYLCKYWARSLFFFALCPIKIHNKQNLYRQKPLIFTANHASYIDALLYLAILPAGTRLIGKQELSKMPIVRTFMDKLQFIALERTDLPKVLEDSKQIETLLQEGHSIGLFPEGTFAYAAGLRPFKIGAFKVAAETNTAISPISINSTRYILRGEERLLKPGAIEITVGEPILPQGKDWHMITNLKTQVRTQIAKYCGEPSLDLITGGIVEE